MYTGGVSGPHGALMRIQNTHPAITTEIRKPGATRARSLEDTKRPDSGESVDLVALSGSTGLLQQVSSASDLRQERIDRLAAAWRADVGQPDVERIAAAILRHGFAWGKRP